MHERQWPASPIRTDLLLQLPRELRDNIYADAFPPTQPFPLHYKVNTFILNLEAELQDLLADPTSEYAQPKAHIRHLIINCDERYTPVTDPVKYEETQRTRSAQLRWEKLYEIPHLQDLTINMDKHRNDSLCTLDFSPILYVLRARNPSLSITFNLSFDTILWYHWDHGEWLEFAGRAVPWPTDEHQPMGYVDISDLMAPPSEDDVAYVTEHLEEYWTEKKMPQNRNIRDGLLDESPSNWRVLAKNYAVKEPLLLRCRMKEQFEVYRRYRMGVGEKDRGE